MNRNIFHIGFFHSASTLLQKNIFTNITGYKFVNYNKKLINQSISYMPKDFGKYCGIITSYQPNPSFISSEPTNSEERYKFDTYKKFVLENNENTETYEKRIKKQFIKEP